MAARGPASIGSSLEDELALATPDQGPRARRYASTAFATVAACAALAACSALAGARQAGAGAARGLRGPPVTVRALLEGPELTEVATHNVVAVGRGILGPVDRAAARAEVATGFKELSETIKQHDSETHDRLGELQLSQEQKDSVLRVLRHYSDPRMLILSHDLASAVRATADEEGDKETLKRHLSETLRARQEELRQLHEEMFPDHPAGVRLNSDDLHLLLDFDAWHASFKVQMTASTEPAVAAATGGSRPSALPPEWRRRRGRSSTSWRAFSGTSCPRRPPACSRARATRTARAAGTRTRAS